MEETSFLSSTELNNRGAFFIETRGYDQAICVLSQALKTTITEMKASKEADSSLKEGKPAVRKDEMIGSLEEDTLDNEPFTCFIRYTPPCQQEGCNMKPTSSKTETEERCGYVYKQPIRIPETHYHMEEAQFQTNSSAVILFNLALARHMRAMEDDSLPPLVPSMILMSKALTMYEFCNQVLAQDGIQADILFDMSLANNMGQLHTVLKSTLKARLCFEHLLATIMFHLVNYGGKQEFGDDSLTSAGDDVLDGFLENASQLLILSSKTAAAA
jgi:hypothetical protein